MGCDVSLRAFGPALRQAHLDHDRIWPLRKKGVDHLGLPFVSVEVTHDEDEALPIGVNQKGTGIETLIVHLDRHDADPPF